MYTQSCEAMSAGCSASANFPESAMTPVVMSPFSLVPETCVPDTVST